MSEPSGLPDAFVLNNYDLLLLCKVHLFNACARWLGLDPSQIVCAYSIYRHCCEGTMVMQGACIQVESKQATSLDCREIHDCGKQPAATRMSAGTWLCEQLSKERLSPGEVSQMICHQVTKHKEGWSLSNLKQQHRSNVMQALIVEGLTMVVTNCSIE